MFFVDKKLTTASPTIPDNMRGSFSLRSNTPTYERIKIPLLNSIYSIFFFLQKKHCRRRLYYLFNFIYEISSTLEINYRDLSFFFSFVCNPGCRQIRISYYFYELWVFDEGKSNQKVNWVISKRCSIYNTIILVNQNIKNIT